MSGSECLRYAAPLLWAVLLFLLLGHGKRMTFVGPTEDPDYWRTMHKHLWPQYSLAATLCMLLSSAEGISAKGVIVLYLLLITLGVAIGYWWSLLSMKRIIAALSSRSTTVNATLRYLQPKQLPALNRWIDLMILIACGYLGLLLSLFMS